jgi:2-dehydropantoate 2-reductase
VNSVRIAVVGVGAIGGAVAADLLDLARHDIVLVARAAFATLEVRHPSGVSKHDVALVCDPADAEPVDWVLIATKAHQSAETRPMLAALCGSETSVAVLQNGVDHEERIRPLVSAETQILPVVVQLPAEKTAPGCITQLHDGGLTVPDGALGQAFCQLFEGARTHLSVSPDFKTQAWWKLLSNAALGGVCALTLRENGVAADSEVRELVLSLMREVMQVARAEGANLPDDAGEKALRMMVGSVPDHWSSITVDRREGRAMEWEVRNRIVGERGRRHGIPTPLNDLITTLLRVADQSGSA